MVRMQRDFKEKQINFPPAFHCLDINFGFGFSSVTASTATCYVPFIFESLKHYHFQRFNQLQRMCKVFMTESSSVRLKVFFSFWSINNVAASLVPRLARCGHVVNENLHEYYYYYTHQEIKTYREIVLFNVAICHRISNGIVDMKLVSYPNRLL